MKKFLVVLLSLGLIAAFATTASALDVKFKGQYYVTGQYESNRGFANSNERSLQNWWTRTRIQTTFKVAEGLDFTTRIDALEKQWGDNTGNTTSNADRSNSRTTVAGSTLQSNIEWERAYVTFKTAAGKFDVGYQAAGEWGTGFGNTPASRPRVKMTSPIGPFTILAIFEKKIEDQTGNNEDTDTGFLAGIYKFKGGDAGLLFSMSNSSGAMYTNSYRTKAYGLTPYMKATFGPVYVEAEFQYLFGKVREYESGLGTDLKKSGIGAYALAKMKFGPAYAGLSFGYSSGDNDATDDTDNTGTVSSTQWSPGIIFGDANYKTWSQGGNPGNATTTGGYNNSNKQNLLALNAFGGFNPTPKLNIDAQFWYLTADKKPTNYDSKNYGMEFDVTATYKIYDNLSYMVGAGYFWAGDYFKGTNTANQIGNDYVLLNKLTLNF